MADPVLSPLGFWFNSDRVLQSDGTYLDSNGDRWMKNGESNWRAKGPICQTASLVKLDSNGDPTGETVTDFMGVVEPAPDLYEPW